MTIFVNRTLNFKKIKAIGFDQDHTILRYHTKNFEELVYSITMKKLVEVKKYPKEILNLKFEFGRVIQGLVIDKKRGTLLKLSRFGKVKCAYFGEQRLSPQEQSQTYGNRRVELMNPHIQSLDTDFSISNGIIYSQLVEFKKTNNTTLPDFYDLADDVREMIDLSHSDNSIKGVVTNNLEKYLVQDKQIVQVLERLKRYGKKIILITNSEFKYSQATLTYAINPFLKDHKDWKELFTTSITLSAKPAFFQYRRPFLKVDTETAMLQNYIGDVSTGIYQGGNSAKLQEDLNLSEDEILYLGDHIYGDVVTIKKTCNWRTALVCPPLDEEIESLKKSSPVQESINKLMQNKIKLEKELNTLDLQKSEEGINIDQDKFDQLVEEIDKINAEISSNVQSFIKYFNPYWGELMRAGNEESIMADQIEKYSCIYMSSVADLLEFSPKTYFRPFKRVLPHENLDF